MCIDVPTKIVCCQPKNSFDVIFAYSKNVHQFKNIRFDLWPINIKTFTGRHIYTYIHILENSLYHLAVKGQVEGHWIYENDFGTTSLKNPINWFLPFWIQQVLNNIRQSKTLLMAWYFTLLHLNNLYLWYIT